MMNKKILLPFLSLLILILPSCLEDNSGAYLLVENNTGYNVLVKANDEELGIVESQSEKKYEMEVGFYYLSAQENVPGSTNIHNKSYNFYSGNTLVWTLNE